MKHILITAKNAYLKALAELATAAHTYAIQLSRTAGDDAEGDSTPKEMAAYLAGADHELAARLLAQEQVLGEWRDVIPRQRGFLGVTKEETR